MQETVREGYYKQEFEPLTNEPLTGQVAKRKSDGSLWITKEVIGGLKCTRRVLRTLTRSEAKQLGLAQ